MPPLLLAMGLFAYGAWSGDWQAPALGTLAFLLGYFLT